MPASAAGIDKMGGRHRLDSSGGRTVLPERVNDKSYMESFYTFFQDLTQSYAHSSPPDQKETIIWVRFFSYPDVTGYEELDKSGNSPMLLAFGYSNGIQMWNLMPTGEAQEVFSRRDGPVKTACLLPPPPPSDATDEFQKARPLLAICMGTDGELLYANVHIHSLRDGSVVKSLKLPSDVMQMDAGPAPVFLITTKKLICGYCTRTLQCIFKISGCYEDKLVSNPSSLGRRWLAYSPCSLATNCQSVGGVAGEVPQTYVASVINAAKTIGKGISTFSDTVNWLAAKGQQFTATEENGVAVSFAPSATPRRSSGHVGFSEPVPECIPGLVTVLDVAKLCKSSGKVPPVEQSGLKEALEITAEADPSFVVAHFMAHAGQPIACMSFGPSGRLLATADVTGHAFHVFSIFPHPGGAATAAVHHMYILRRGETTAEIQDLRFSWDRRWLVASSLRGTCHVFPVLPYGGTPCVRTHTSDRVVNKLSRYHKSAGLDELTLADRQHQPVAVPRSLSDASASSPQGVLGYKSQSRVLSARSLTVNNPRLPPLPVPVVVPAFAQIRTGPSTAVPSMLPGQNAFTSSSSDASSLKIAIATRFLHVHGVESTSHSGGSAQPRSKSPREKPSGGSQRLLIASSSGLLTEYLLEPRGQPEHGSQKVHDNSSIDLAATACVCWPLQRSASWNVVELVLSPRNPLLLADDRCKQFHETVRSKNKSRQNHARSRPTVSNGTATSRPPAASDSSSHVPPGGARTVCSEQPKPRESQSRPVGRATPGGAVPRRRKAKKSSDESATENVAPAFEAMQRDVEKKSDQEEKSSSSNGGSSAHLPAVASPTLSLDVWPSKVEMVTHDSPARRLWMGPQFHFKPMQSTGNTHVLSAESSSLLSQQHHQSAAVYSNGFTPGDAVSENLCEEELDYDSLRFNAVRSQPVATPAPRLGSCPGDADLNGCCDGMSTVMIESGSGNFDKAANMLEINSYGSLEDRNSFPDRANEDKLKQRIADAMVEEYGASARSKHFSQPLPSAQHTNNPLLEGGRASEHGEFESLNMVPDQFDFSNADPPVHHLPG